MKRPDCFPWDEEAQRTLYLESATGEHKAQPMVNGKTHFIEGHVFTLDKSADAIVHLGGLSMRPVQATIVREGCNSSRLLDVKGGAARGDGQWLQDGAERDDLAIWRSGDAIAIGKHQVVIVLVA